VLQSARNEVAAEVIARIGECGSRIAHRALTFIFERQRRIVGISSDFAAKDALE